MAKENNKKKKDAYPSKKTLNLYFKDDKTSKPSTIMLYCLFALVVLLASAKLFVYDVWAELEEEKKIYAQNEKLLQGYMEKLSGFGELKEEYNKYTFDYLKADEKYCDRMDILNVIDQTIRKEARIERINIHANGVEVTFEGVNLEQTSILATKIEAYDNVKSVSIVSASLSSKTGTYSVVMDIYFKSVEGGKQ